MIWKVLGIEKTKDKETIRNAYHEKLHFVNPEDDQEGFKELRRAYEEAMEYADTIEDNKTIDDGKAENELTEDSNKNKTEVDFWIDRIDKIYVDAATRRDVTKWNELLNDPLCDDLDTEMEASEKLLVYIMSHSYLPMDVWQTIDKRFHYLDGMDQLKEHFPEDFLSYVKWQTNHPGFVDFDLFDGDTSCDVDKYINRLHELKNAEEERDFSRINKLIMDLEEADISHPYLFVEKAIVNLLQAGELHELLLSNQQEDSNMRRIEKATDEDKDRFRKNALEIMEDIDFEYSQNSYIHRVYGEALLANHKTEQAKAVFEELLETDPASYSALLCRAKCTIVEGDYELAKEQLEDILEERVQDVETLRYLDVVNETLVVSYTKKLSQGLDKDTVIKLGWCYYQEREFEKGIELLDELGESMDYDFVNLRCRLYLANDEYEKAYPWAKEWLKQIVDSVDDGSKEMKKRKNRLSLAHFSLGVCIWENALKNDTISEKEDEAVSFIQKAIDEENNQLVRLSYMEQLARFYLAAEKYEKCVDKCTEIIEIDQGFFPAYVHRQKANFELRQAREVIEDYYACTDIYPEYAPPYILAAEVFYAFEQYDDVESIINRAAEVNIDSDALELYKVRLMHYKDFSDENLKKARSAIEKLKIKVDERTGEYPTDIEKLEDIYREYAVICWDMDEDEKALEILDEFLAGNPECTSLMMLQSDILLRGGNEKEALQISKDIYKISPTVYHQTRLGITYERINDYDNALKNYKEAYEKDPRDAGVVRRLMYLYSFLSDKKRDLELCKTGIRYATEFIDITNAAEGYVERGNLYIDLYELEKAVEDCKKAIELNPEAYYAYNNLGCALLKLRRVDEAIPPLEHAVEMDREKDHLPFLNLAECYTVKKEYEKAINQYKTLLEIFPKHTYVLKDIAELYCKMRMYSKAVEYYEKQIKEKLKNIPQKGILDNLKGGNKDVVADEEQLMKLYCDLADVYRQAGNTSKAEAYYDKVLKRWKNIVKPHISVKPIISIAEYYRDSGQVEKAVKLIKTAFGKMTEKDRNSTVWKQLSFAAATIYFEAKDTLNAKNEGKIYFEQFRKWEGEFDKALSDARYKPCNLYNIGIIYLCMGDIDKAKEFISDIPDCRLCVMCECADCFEYYFGMGLIAEVEGRRDEAVKCYEKAIEIKGDYPCAENHLSMCKR